MTSEQTAGANPKPAEENAGGQTSGELPFEIPECCRQMMSQMMGRTSSDSPGILGRLMLRMMKACSGRFAAKQSKAV